MPRLRTICVTALAALFAPALFAVDMQNASPANAAVPGTLNYIEGSASIDGQSVTRSAIGSATLAAGQVISTSNGRAEVLLTPGVFLRLGHNSSVKMVSPELTNTVVSVQRGRADIEVDQLFPDNDIHILENHVPVQLIKTGLYEFNASRNTVLVFSGEAAVPKQDGKWVTIKGHHELNIAEGVTMKPTKFNVNRQEQSGLYRWSSLRSDYLAQANQQMAPEYGAGYAPGWYWDPYAFDYTFLGPSPFYSPFGWGYYPFGGYGGWGYGGWGGFYGPGFYGHPGHAVGPHGPVNLPRGGFGGSALRGGGAYRGGGLNSGAFHSTFGGGGHGGRR